MSVVKTTNKDGIAIKSIVIEQDYELSKLLHLYLNSTLPHDTPLENITYDERGELVVKKEKPFINKTA
jgi:hypothetical protein